jgi:hypothetical protein
MEHQDNRPTSKNPAESWRQSRPTSRLEYARFEKLLHSKLPSETPLAQELTAQLRGPVVCTRFLLLMLIFKMPVVSAINPVACEGRKQKKRDSFIYLRSASPTQLRAVTHL